MWFGDLLSHLLLFSSLRRSALREEGEEEILTVFRDMTKHANTVI